MANKKFTFSELVRLYERTLNYIEDNKIRSIQIQNSAKKLAQALQELALLTGTKNGEKDE